MTVTLPPLVTDIGVLTFLVGLIVANYMYVHKVNNKVNERLTVYEQRHGESVKLLGNEIERLRLEVTNRLTRIETLLQKEA